LVAANSGVLAKVRNSFITSLSGGLQILKPAITIYYLEILTFFPKRYKIKDKKLPKILFGKENNYGSN
jgi:hypothetical protein